MPLLEIYKDNEVRASAVQASDAGEWTPRVTVTETTMKIRLEMPEIKKAFPTREAAEEAGLRFGKEWIDVDDQEMEAIAELVHVPVGALEGGDRQRRQPPHTVAIAPDGAAVHAPDLPKPLIQQDTGGDQTQCGEPHPAHRGHGEARLTTPGRKGDDAAAVPHLPRGQGRFLVGSKVDVRPLLLDGPKRRGKILESHTAAQEPALEGGVTAGGRPMGADARVPANPRRLGEVELPGRIGHQDGAAVESQSHDRRWDRNSGALRLSWPHATSLDTAGSTRLQCPKMNTRRQPAPASHSSSTAGRSKALRPLCVVSSPGSSSTLAAVHVAPKWSGSPVDKRRRHSVADERTQPNPQLRVTALRTVAGAWQTPPHTEMSRSSTSHR